MPEHSEQEIASGQMSGRYEFDPAINRVNVFVAGPADLQAIFCLAANLVEDDQFKAGMNTLWDLTELDVSEIFGKDIEAIRGMPRKSVTERGRARVALVVRDAITFGVSRMFESMAGLEFLEYRVFQQMDEAESWLDELLPGR